MKKPDALTPTGSRLAMRLITQSLNSEGARSMLRKFSTKGVPQCL
jgi:hypothetical protein